MELEQNPHLLLYRIKPQLFIRWNGNTVFGKTFQIAADSVLRHSPSFIERITFSNQAGQGGARHHIAAFFSRFKEHRKDVFPFLESFPQHAFMIAQMGQYVNSASPGARRRRPSERSIEE